MAKTLSERLTHIRNAFKEAKQAPLLSTALLVLAFVATLVLEEVWSWGVDRWKPEYLRSESEIAAADLTVRTETIASSVDQIEAILRAMQQGEDIDGDVLERKMTELLDGIDDLTPQLALVSALRTDLLQANIRQKSDDVSSLGYSTASDINLFLNLGVTICPERYTIAVTTPTDDQRIRATFRLSAPDGSTQTSFNTKVGENITLPTDGEVMSVTYSSHNIVNGRAVYGVNFSCPT
ncbi:MAG: hypothetical protein ABJ327_01165 [Litoreibacter sp.]